MTRTDASDIVSMNFQVYDLRRAVAGHRIPPDVYNTDSAHAALRRYLLVNGPHDRNVDSCIPANAQFLVVGTGAHFFRFA